MSTQELAQKHGFSLEAVLHLQEAFKNGGGAMAQFNHQEFGGMGQWMNGMIMIGSMFDNALKARVDALCRDILQHPAPHSASNSAQFSSASISTAEPWYGAALGNPSQSGAQNSLRYAYFPAKERFVVEDSGKRTIYNTRNHAISGISIVNNRIQLQSASGEILSLQNLPILEEKI